MSPKGGLFFVKIMNFRKFHLFAKIVKFSKFLECYDSLHFGRLVELFLTIIPGDQLKVAALGLKMVKSSHFL